jgi:hypothetical protein
VNVQTFSEEFEIMTLKVNLENIRLVHVLSCPQVLTSVTYIDAIEIRCNLMHKFTFGGTFYHLPSKQMTSVNPSSRYVTFYSLKFNYKKKSVFLKLKLKSLPGAFSALRPRGPIVFLPQQVPAFISRGAKHHTDARDLYQRRRELPPQFCQRV